MKRDNQWDEMAKEAVHPFAWKVFVIGATLALIVLLAVYSIQPVN